MGRVFISLSIFLVTISFSGSYAQTSVVQGVVTDASGNPLPGAGLVIKGTTTGGMTDQDGKFRIQAEPGQTLVVSFLGFLSREELITGSAEELRIVLEQDSRYLDEVVITGALGIERAAREVGGGSQVLSSAVLNQGKTVNPIFGMTSKVAGLRINMYDSKVDPQVRILMRGTRSLSRSSGIDGRGANEPIYVVDGVPVPSISRLNPNDIESITVLKGANAAALYGSEGVNGAIMITTRRGREDRAEV